MANFLPPSRRRPDRTKPPNPVLPSGERDKSLGKAYGFRNFPPEFRGILPESFAFEKFPCLSAIFHQESGTISKKMAGRKGEAKILKNQFSTLSLWPAGLIAVKRGANQFGVKPGVCLAQTRQSRR